MPSKTFLKQAIDGKETTIKRLQFENKQLTKTIEELQKRNENLQSALNEKIAMLKTASKRKWFPFWQ